MPQVYPPSADVMQVGETTREMFFCQRGRCAVLNQDGVQIFIIKDGMTFGEVGVFFSVKCTATIQTLEYTDLLSLSKASLIQSMRDYPKQSERINKLTQERVKQLGIHLE